MTYFPPPWTPNEIPPSYERITWQESLERIPADYRDGSESKSAAPDYHDVEARSAWEKENYTNTPEFYVDEETGFTEEIN